MKIPNAIGRASNEWIGATPDTRAPDYVRLRVFNRYHGICYLSGKKIRPGDAWDLEHVKALCNGGENRESNMAPAFRGKVHQQKTASDRALKAKTDSMQRKHIGIPKKKKKMGYRKFNGEIVLPRYE